MYFPLKKISLVTEDKMVIFSLKYLKMKSQDISFDLYVNLCSCLNTKKHSITIMERDKFCSYFMTFACPLFS